MSRHSNTKERTNVKKRKKRIGLKIFILMLIILAILGGIFAKKVYELDGNWIAAIFGHNKETLKNLDRIDILVMGESTGSTDTILIISYNPKTQAASMLSIPRDTFTGDKRSNAKSSNKINSLYTNGNTPEKTLNAVNKITGLDLKYYVIVDTKAFVKLVNLIGGVEFDVPMNMEYDDYDQNLHIRLNKGYQKLTGEQVEMLVRFRHNNDGSTYSYEYGDNDYGRMRTQREVIKAIANKTLKFKNILEIRNLLDIVKEDVETNIDVSLAKDYIPYAVNMNMEEIKTEQLPGESDKVNGIWFFFNDKEKTQEVIDELFTKETIDTINN